MRIIWLCFLIYSQSPTGYNHQIRLTDTVYFIFWEAFLARLLHVLDVHSTQKLLFQKNEIHTCTCICCSLAPRLS